MVKVLRKSFAIEVAIIYKTFPIQNLSCIQYVNNEWRAYSNIKQCASCALITLFVSDSSWGILKFDWLIGRGIDPLDPKL